LEWERLCFVLPRQYNHFVVCRSYCHVLITSRNSKVEQCVGTCRKSVSLTLCDYIQPDE